MIRHKLMAGIIFVFVLFISFTLHAEVQREKFQSNGNYLIVEILDDDLAHFEYGVGAGPDVNDPVVTTDMVCKMSDQVPSEVCSDYDGPEEYSKTNNEITTEELMIVVNSGSLEVSVFDKTKNNIKLIKVNPLNLNNDLKGLILRDDSDNMDYDIYGLGQKFVEPGNSDIDWDSRTREGGDYGNVMEGFNGGMNGNTQIPVMYAVKANDPNINYALFLDNKYRHKWDFTGQDNWKVEMYGDRIRFYVLSGPDLLDLRKDYMELVGRPLVPPKKMFGLWMSEYGYDEWNEVDETLGVLDHNRFPLDGFVLDLQWFGGIPEITGQCRMGSLSFDENKFSNPDGKIGEYKSRGIGIMLIEEAYVCEGLPEYDWLKSRDYLVKRPDCNNPCDLECTGNMWWCGDNSQCGGMIDYINDDASRQWHDLKRQPLVNKNIIGHWTDLGEPELYCADCRYSDSRACDFTQADAHNIFNFRWLRGIYQGYQRNNEQKRPFMMSRSGAAGIQRFGAAMWSGDIASKLSSLASHSGSQMHMSFSGIDYYGADIGGFRREQLDGDVNSMYTQWFANGLMFDIPARPHTDNHNCKYPSCTTSSQYETSPAKVGDLQSNLENARLRYRLIPYLYSLAYNAYKSGEPVMPPLIVYYQNDNNVRNMGHEKMLGKDLIAGIVAAYGETHRDVYLPAGTWINWHTKERIYSQGIWVSDVPEYYDGQFKLPLFAREGAIIPVMHVDENTVDALGTRRDRSVRNELIAKVFAFDREDEEYGFTLFEDDGKTVAYLQGEYRKTEIRQKRTDNSTLTVTVSPSLGTYVNAPDFRNNIIELVTDETISEVEVNGDSLHKCQSRQAFDESDSCWFEKDSQTVLAKSGVMNVNEEKEYRFSVDSRPCRYTSAAVPGAGNGWNTCDRMLNCTGDGVWTGRVQLCNEEFKFAANCSWDVNWGSDCQQGGPNYGPMSGVYDVVFDENSGCATLNQVAVGDDCSESVEFECKNCTTIDGIGCYVLGNVEQLGEWNSCLAEKLDSTSYPDWSGVIDGLPLGVTIEWKCIKRVEDNCDIIEWEPGENNRFTTPTDTIETGEFPLQNIPVKFVANNGITTSGISIYVIGNVKELGEWKPCDAVKLDPVNYPRWEKVVQNLPANNAIEWKCIKREEHNCGNVIEWEPGENNNFTTPSSGHAPDQFCDF